MKKSDTEKHRLFLARLNELASRERVRLNEHKLNRALKPIFEDSDTESPEKLAEKWFSFLATWKVGYIVEGFNDEKTVLEVKPDAYVVVTKGTRFNNRVKTDVQRALNLCDEVYVLTDPDEPGEHIACVLMKEFEGLKRIEVDRAEALCMRNRQLKVGIEHCDVDYLRQLLVGKRKGE